MQTTSQDCIDLVTGARFQTDGLLVWFATPCCIEQPIAWTKGILCPRCEKDQDLRLGRLFLLSDFLNSYSHWLRANGFEREQAAEAAVTVRAVLTGQAL